MPEELTSKKLIILTLLLLLCLVCIGITLPSFFEHDLLARKINFPAFYQGGWELIGVFGIFAFASLLKNKIKYFALFLISLTSILYLRSHQVLVAFIVTLFYIEGIFQLGYAGASSLGITTFNKTIERYFYFYVLGITIWSLFAICLSLFGFGLFEHLRILTIVLVLLSVVITKFSLPPLSYSLIFKLQQQNNSLSLLTLFFYTFFLSLFAKTNTHIDWDSLSYGLRPEQMLVGENSFYDQFYFIGDMLYYPKMFELIALPLSNLGDYSFILGLNTCYYGFLSLIIYTILSRLHVEKVSNIILTLVTVTIPAISVMATSAKPDMHCTLLFILGLYFLVKFVQESSNIDLLLGLGALLLATCNKITAIGFGPFFILGVLWIVIKYRSFGQKSISNMSTSIVIGLFTLVFVGIHYRTYLLTGYPLIKFTSLWNVLGFEATIPMPTNSKNTYINFASASLMDYLIYFKNAFFKPLNLKGHFGVSWISSITPFLLIVFGFSFLVDKKQKNNRNNFILTLLLTVSLSGLIILISFYARLNPGGDGNYYMIPLIFTVILLAYLLKDSDLFNHKILNSTLFLYVLFHVFLVFLVDLSWNSGTAKFSTNLMKPVIETPLYKERFIKSQKLMDVEQYLKTIKPMPRSISFNVNPKSANLISARNQTFIHLQAWGGTTFKNIDPIVEYINKADIQFLLAKNDKIEKNKILNKILKRFKNSEKVFEHYTLIQLEQMK